MQALPTYVVVTPARNEAQFIEGAIRSMVAQTVRPVKWVIVSDGSTDGTDEIVRRYAVDHPWIELVRMPERKDRHFSGKVAAFDAGHARIQSVYYDVIVSLDGDITFDQGYFSFLLTQLVGDQALGLVGTLFQEDGKSVYDYRFVSIQHVSGACQVFRRQCFEEIGGYLPIKGGGIDYVAVVSARMKGWKTRTFTEMACDHHRTMGTAQNSVVAARFKTGTKDYVLGCHPLWLVFRTAYQMTRKPVVIGGLALLAGYVWAWSRHVKRPVSQELIAFRQREEMERLKRYLTKRVPAQGRLQESA